MVEVVAIKVKIGLRPNGHADHPDWSLLPLATLTDVELRRWRDDTSNPRLTLKEAGILKAAQLGIVRSWIYDKTSGHQESTPDSPRGQQFGVLLVTERFAMEAATVFPDLITQLDETQLQDFWENKAYAHMPDNRVDGGELQALESEHNLSIKLNISQLEINAIEARIAKALDPNDPMPGVRKNKLRRWVNAKVDLGVTIKELP